MFEKLNDYIEWTFNADWNQKRENRYGERMKAFMELVTEIKTELKTGNKDLTRENEIHTSINENRTRITEDRSER